MSERENVVLVDLAEAQAALAALMADKAMIAKVAEAGHLIAESQKAGGTVMSCGNGGSLCDAMHFAEEMTGRFRSDRRAYRAQAISDVAHMACVGNDYGYEDVFSRWVEGHGRAGDVLLDHDLRYEQKRGEGGANCPLARHEGDCAHRERPYAHYGIGGHRPYNARRTLGRPGAGTAHQAHPHSH